MEITEDYFLERKEKAKAIYLVKKEIYNPYFQKKYYFKFRWISPSPIFSSQRKRQKRAIIEI